MKPPSLPKLTLLHALYWPLMWLGVAFLIMWTDSLLGTAPFHKGYHYFLVCSALGSYVAFIAHRKALKRSLETFKNLNKSMGKIEEISQQNLDDMVEKLKVLEREELKQIEQNDKSENG